MLEHVMGAVRSGMRKRVERGGGEVSGNESRTRGLFKVTEQWSEVLLAIELHIFDRVRVSWH